MRRRRGNEGRIWHDSAISLLFILQHHVQQRLLRRRSTPRRILPAPRSVLVGCMVLSTYNHLGGPPPGQGGYYPQQPQQSYQGGYGGQPQYAQGGYQPQPQPNTVYVWATVVLILGVALMVQFSCNRQQPPQQKGGGGGGGGCTACLAGMCLCCCAEGACSRFAVMSLYVNWHVFINSPIEVCDCLF